MLKINIYFYVSMAKQYVQYNVHVAKQNLENIATWPDTFVYKVYMYMVSEWCLGQRLYYIILIPTSTLMIKTTANYMFKYQTFLPIQISLACATYTSHTTTVVL